MSFRKGNKHSCGYSMFVMVTNLCCHLTYESRGASSTRIIFEMLPEIHTMETRDFLQYIIHSQIYRGYLLFRGEYQIYFIECVEIISNFTSA